MENYQMNHMGTMRNENHSQYDDELQNMRIIMRELLYVTGFPPDITLVSKQ